MANATPKREITVRRIVDTAARTVTFKAVDSATTSVVRQFTFNYGDVRSPALQSYAAGHGWNQRLGDTLAQKTGTSLAAKFMEMEALAAYYLGLPEDAPESAWDRPKPGRAAPRELTREEKEALLRKLASELGIYVE